MDVCFFFRFPLYRQGLKELARCGLTLPRQLDWASFLATCLRVTTGVVTGAVTGLFISMQAYAPDLTRKIDATYLAENKAIADRFAATYDASVKRETAAIEDDTAGLRVLDRQISGLQQNETRLTARARRKGTSALAPSSNAQLTALEASRSAVAARLESRKESLAALIEKRNASILKAIDNAPDHHPKRDGFLGRVTAFGELLDQNVKLLLLVVGIEILSLSLELAPVVAHTRYVPSSFAAHVALEHVKAVTGLAREGATHLNAIVRPTAAPASDKADAEMVSPGPTEATPDQSPTPPPLPTVAPIKRGRGRPPRVRPPLNGHDLNSPLSSSDQ